MDWTVEEMRDIKFLAGLMNDWETLDYAVFDRYEAGKVYWRRQVLCMPRDRMRP